MRVLFFSTPAYGHVIPQLPLLRACVAQGDTVAMVSGVDVAPLLAAEGVELLPVSPTIGDVIAEVLRTTGHDLTQGVTVEAEAEFFAGARIDLSYDEAFKAALAWQPDLIVAEHLDFVGPIVGAALGVPVATLAYGPAPAAETLAATADRAAKRHAARGLATDPAQWYLDTCPPALQRPDWREPANRVGLRPEAYRTPGEVAPARPGRSGRPRVLVSFGTIFVVPPLIGAIVRGLVASDLDVVVTLGFQAAPADFGVDSDRVEFVEFTPLAELLPDVAVVVTAGGAGTVIGSLAAGVPLVVTPLGADQPMHAQRVAAAGAGIAFELGEFTLETVAQAVSTVLSDVSYQDAALKIATEIAALPTPTRAAALLSVL